MEIQNKKHSKRTRPTQSSSFLDDDFASGFEDSKFEKFKPLFKVVVALVIVAGIGYGAYAYLGNKVDNTVRSADTSQPASNDMSELEQCVDKAWDSHKTPEESDPDFYPKLIAGYDAQLACYDKYPDDEKSASNRISIDSARKSAIDSSAEYKDTYLATNSYEYTPSTSSGSYQYTSPSSPGGSSSTSPGGSSSSSGSSSGGGTQPAVDTQWCSAKKAEVDSLYASYQEARTSYQNARDKVATVDYNLRNVSTSRPPGFSGTQNQLELWRESERRRLTAERVPLAAQLSSAEASYNSASAKHLNAQREYISKSC